MYFIFSCYVYENNFRYCHEDEKNVLNKPLRNMSFSNIAYI